MPKTNQVNDATVAAEQTRVKFDDYMRELESNRTYSRDVMTFKRVSLYRMRGELGTGNFSFVKMAIHELTNEKVAVKVFMKDKLELKAYDMALSEIAIQAEIEHPHVVRLYEAIDTPTRLYIATEFVGGGELFFRIADEGRLPDDMARTVFRQIVDAVAYLHSKMIVHRDLKAENVMFSSSKELWVKLGDFGFSTRVKSHDEMLTTFCGSPPYAAPELYRDEKYDGFRADIWSLGVLLYFIVTGMLPFRSSQLPELRKLITQGRFRIPEALPEHCRQLLTNLMVQDPSLRPSLHEVSNSLWLQDVDLPSKQVSEHLTDSEHRDTRTSRTLEILDELGIDREKLEEHSSKSVWSAVNGCYRIVNHRLEKINSGEPEHHDFPFHLYNLGYEPQRYRVSSGQVVTATNPPHQVAKVDAAQCVPSPASLKPSFRKKSSSNKTKPRKSDDVKRSTVCSIV